VKDFDEMIEVSDLDFKDSGLKHRSLIRVSRLAVVNETFLPGSIGKISEERLQRISKQLRNWLVID
jgi:mRNA interferase MazF